MEGSGLLSIYELGGLDAESCCKFEDRDALVAAVVEVSKGCPVLLKFLSKQVEVCGIPDRIYRGLTPASQRHYWRLSQTPHAVQVRPYWASSALRVVCYLFDYLIAFALTVGV